MPPQKYLISECAVKFSFSTNSTNYNNNYKQNATNIEECLSVLNQHFLLLHRDNVQNRENEQHKENVTNRSRENRENRQNMQKREQE